MTAKTVTAKTEVQKKMRVSEEARTAVRRILDLCRALGAPTTSSVILSEALRRGLQETLTHLLQAGRKGKTQR